VREDDASLGTSHRHDGLIGDGLKLQIAKMDPVVTVLDQIASDTDAQSHVDQESHAAGAPVAVGYTSSSVVQAA